MLVMVILTMMDFVLYVILRFSSYSYCSPEGGNLTAEDYGVEGAAQSTCIRTYCMTVTVDDTGRTNPRDWNRKQASQKREGRYGLTSRSQAIAP